MKRSAETPIDPFKRALILALPALVLSKTRAFSNDVVELSWADLMPEGQPFIPESLFGIIDHDTAPLYSQQPASSGVRTDWNGQTVKIPGYVLPIDFEGTGVKVFILVPYVGACVHVPPPPANQLVLVTAETPYQSNGLFEAVNVTGLFGTTSTSTELADVGYALAAERIEPHRF